MILADVIGMAFAYVERLQYLLADLAMPSEYEFGHLVVFLQQLGRGLRLADNKPRLTVLDFIGNRPGCGSTSGTGP